MSAAGSELPNYMSDAIYVLESLGRPVTVQQAAELGINRMTLSQLATLGYVERPVRGVYHMPTVDDDQRVFWAAVSLGYDAVFCLTSAASFHGLTEEGAGVPDISLPLRSRVPDKRSFEIRMRFHHWPDAARTTDVDTVEIQGVGVRITSPARTVVDMYRHSELNDDPRFKVVVGDTTFLDCLSRFLERDELNTSSAELRRTAEDHGCWEDIKRLSSAILTTRERMSPR